MGADDVIPVEVESVVMSTQGPVVLLTPTNGDAGDKLLPIFIDPSQAFNIQMVLKGHIPPRPMTHDLFSTVMHELGAMLDRVVIEDLANNTFFASMFVRLSNGDGEERRFDARPSDGIALAVRSNAQLYVRRKVIDEAAVSRDKVQSEEVLTVEQADEEDVDLGVKR